MKAEATGTIRNTDATSSSATVPQEATSSSQPISPIQGMLTVSGKSHPTSQKNPR